MAWKLHSEDWEVRPVPLADAQALVREHHYAKGGSNTAVYTHGLYHRLTDLLVGVVWWLPPTRVACESVNKAEWQKVLSLTRMVMIPGAPKNACSFLLARSIKEIKREGRFVSLVTYADESQNHDGGVYRAANWEYVGRTGPYPRWLDKDGKQVAPKATTNRTKAQMEALGHTKVGSFYKHKFVLHLRPPALAEKRNESTTGYLTKRIGLRTGLGAQRAGQGADSFTNLA